MGSVIMHSRWCSFHQTRGTREVHSIVVELGCSIPLHFSILSLSLVPHHLTNYLTYHLTCAPDLVPHDWGAHAHSHNPVTDHLILTLDFSCDQACNLSCDTMWLIMHLTSQVPDPVIVPWHMTRLNIFGLTDCILYWWHIWPCWLWLTPIHSLNDSYWLGTVRLLLTPSAAYCTTDWLLTVQWLGLTTTQTDSY